jgi:hypothetical protein
MFLMLFSVQASYAADLAEPAGAGCRKCPGGGGGGSGSPLTPAEVSGLLYMREEEKLARDSYLTH